MKMRIYVMVSYCLQVQDIFPYSIALYLYEGDQTYERKVFPKGSLFPNDKIVTHRVNNAFYLHVSYTNKTDFPAGISPKIGHFKERISMCVIAAFVHVLLAILYSFIL